MSQEPFKPALLVIDFQEDFCPPSGSLAVPEGRTISPQINTLLQSPLFTLKLATQDWHPQNHISFAANHPPAEPFVSFTTVTNPHNALETYSTRLWPVHCVQDTPGAALVPELRADLLDDVIKKGVVAEVEMYSAFYDPFREPRVYDSGLAGRLKGEGVTHVYVVGLAADYCVRASAEDAVREGFVTYIVEEATRPVDGAAWEIAKRDVEAAGVKIVSFGGPEVARVLD